MDTVNPLPDTLQLQEFKNLIPCCPDMGKGGTRFVGDAVGVRAKAKGYGGKDMKKVRSQLQQRRQCAVHVPPPPLPPPPAACAPRWLHANKQASTVLSL